MIDFSEPQWTTGVDALAQGVRNKLNTWHNGAIAEAPEPGRLEASSRLAWDYAKVAPAYTGPRLHPDDGVYAIGSCFAREIENHLQQQGVNVLSRPSDSVFDPVLLDDAGRPKLSYLHRYTPQSMAQDVRRALAGLPDWDEDESLIFSIGDKRLDFDLGWIGTTDYEIEGLRSRRRAVRRLSEGLARSRCVIVTLGLVEAWYHKPSGLWCNKVSPGVLRRRADEFAFCITTHDQTMQALKDIRDLLRTHCAPGVQMVVTVSPVPLQMTFTRHDIIVANAESKAILRAAAGAFVRRHDDVHYFPSYEMVTQTDPARAWAPDRIHVQPPMVRHIVSTFVRSWYKADLADGAQTLKTETLKTETLKTETLKLETLKTESSDALEPVSG